MNTPSPFASEEKIEVALKKEVEKIPSTPPQIPPLPSNSLQNLPKISVPSDLPPIPSQRPILPETVSQPSEKFILTGTAIGANKNAIVKKISLSQEKEQEENIIVGVGDYVQGRQIVDITGNALLFDDNQNPMYISGFDSFSVNLSANESEVSDIVTENKILEIPPIYEESLTKNNISNMEEEIITIKKQVSDIETTKNISVEYENNQKNILPSDEKNSINSNTTIDDFSNLNNNNFSPINDDVTSNAMSGTPPSDFENLSLEK